MASIWDYNGSSVLAMTGKGCVGIASDMRLGVNRFKTISTEFPKAFKMTDKCYLGLTGLATDVQTFSEEMAYRLRLFPLREERAMATATVRDMVGSILYGRRFSPYFIGPVVAGLSATDEPIIAAFDAIGAAGTADDFVVNGTAVDQLYGACETCWRPGMGPDDLFETMSQCMLAGVDRDCVSGWGAIVHIITPEQIITKRLKGRLD